MFYFSKVGSRALPKIAAVYCIEDYITGERYVGSTNNLRNRLYYHAGGHSATTEEMMSRRTYSVSWTPVDGPAERVRLEQLLMDAVDCLNQMDARMSVDLGEYMRQYRKRPGYKEYQRQYRAKKKLNKQLDIA